MTSPVDSLPVDPGAPAGADSGLFGLNTPPSEARLIVQPVPWDATTSYGTGTRLAPGAILRASHQIDLFDLDTGRPYEAGIAMLEVKEEVLRRNDEARHWVEALRKLEPTDPERKLLVDRVNRASATTTQELYEATQSLMETHSVVGTLGGDHSSPLGAIVAHAERYEDMGILHIDAHADLRPHYEDLVESHASIMHNVLERTPIPKLVQVGLRDLCEEEYARIKNSGRRIEAFFDSQLNEAQEDGIPFATLAKEIVSRLPQKVYLSFDIDGLEPVCAPNTGTPVPGGLSFRQVVRLMLEVVRSKRQIVGFDLVEVSPRQDDEWDANVGARLLYKMCGFALMNTPLAP